MANRFEVQVVALDRYTKTFRDLNDRASRSVRPIVNIQRQLGALAHEAHLDKIAAGMGSVSRAASSMSRTIGLSLGPLEEVLGLGAAGGIVGAFTAAGLAAAALGVRVATAGFEVNRTSRALGVSTDDLQRYRGAAKLAGVETDVVDRFLGDLGDTLQNARFGRDAPALVALNRLGVPIRLLKDGSVDVVAATRDIANALSTVSDAHVQNVIADALHIPRDALPLLRDGSASLERFADEAQRLGMVQGPAALKWANDFTYAMNGLRGTLDGVMNDWGNKFVPALTAGIEKVDGAIKSSGFFSGLLTSAGQGMSKASHYGGIFAGPMAIAGAAWQALGGLGGGTTPDQRMVSGSIGGALSNGPYRPVGGGTISNLAGSMQPGDPGYDAAMRSDAESILRAELARATTNEDRAAITREIQRRAGSASGMDSIASPQKVHVTVDFRNAPAGTSATARDMNGFLPTRISYSMPTGDGP